MSRRHGAVLRGWPGTAGWKAPGTAVLARSLSATLATYVAAAGDAGTDDDRFGLAAVLVARGPLIFHALLVVPDDLDPARRASVGRWARSHHVETVAGPAPWRVVNVSTYFAPTATRETAPWAFVPNAYNSHGDPGPVVGADMGRSFGLMAEHVVARRGRSAGSWEVWLPGWGRDSGDGQGWKRRSPHRPPLRLQGRRVGWSVGFGPCVPGCGKRTRGEFVDVLSLAYAFDADRAAGFVEHARHFGIDAAELPVAVAVDGTGAASMAAAVADVHHLAMVLDDKAGRWYTTPEDRAQGVRRLPVGRLQSPAAPADFLLRRFGVQGLLEKFRLDEAGHRAWTEAFYGGDNDDDPRLLGVPFRATGLDLTSAYPLAAVLVGWWGVVTAEHLGHEVVTGALRRVCKAAVTDPAAALDPALWRRFGLTLAEVVPNGDLLPIATDDPHRPDGRVDIARVTAKGRPMFYSWADVVADAIRTRRVPEIVQAVRLVPSAGRQQGLRRRVPVVPGLVLDVGEDPVLGLVRRRREAKAAGETVLAAELHAMTNSLVSGNPSRLDDGRRKAGRRWETVERPGPWTFMPLAVTVTAGARLLLAVVERMVTDRGGIVAYVDTDSSIIPASPEGGTLALGDGMTVRELSWAEVDEIAAAFDSLSPGPDWPVWKLSPPRDPAGRPLHCIVFGPKRHAEYRREPDGSVELVEWTEAGLGGMWADPPAMQGRCPEGGRAWSKAAVEREVRYAEAKAEDPERAAREPAPWDAGSALHAPTLRRLQVTRPDVLAALPDALGARVGTRYVEAMVDDMVAQPVRSVVARNPGGPLDDWSALRWLDRGSGEPVAVTTDMRRYGTGAVVVEPLAARAGRYGAAPKNGIVEEVVVTPLSVRYRGRVSGVIDAQDDGVPGDLRRFRLVYENAHGLGPGQYEALVELAKTLSFAEFARRGDTTPRTAQTIADGHLPRPTVTRRLLTALRAAELSVRACALVGCDHPVDRQGALYCCPVHAEVGRKRRQRAGRNTGST